MFTQILLSGTPSPLLTATHSTGVKLTGNTSGATGFVKLVESRNDGGAGDNRATGAKVSLVNVSGSFIAGENIIASDSSETSGIIENSSNADLTISEVTNFLFSETRSAVMEDVDGGQNFTCDFVLTRATENDVFRNTGSDADGVDADDFIVLDDDGSTRLGIEPVKIAKLEDAEKNILVYRMPKAVIKTLLTDDNDGLSDSTITIRKQFVGTTNSSGVVSFTAGTNETFAAFASKDYSLSILTAGGGTGAQGDLVNITSTISGTGTATVTVTDNTILGSSAKVKFIGTVVKTSVQSRIKTTNLMKGVKVLATDVDGSFGIRASDKTISLGRPDVYRLMGVFDSEDTSADATLPSMTITSSVGTFDRGERITGGTSGAVARISNAASPLEYVLIGGFGQ